MRRLNFCKNGIYLTFEVDDLGRLLFLRLGTDEGEPARNPHRLFEAVELHLTGSDPDDLHGAKHCGGGGYSVLQYQYHTETPDSISFVLESEEVRATLLYEFYEGIRVIRAYSEITNISQCAIGLEYISSLCLYGMKIDRVMIPHNSWWREVNWREYTMEELGHSAVNLFSTKRTSISNTGTWSSKEYLPMGCIKENDKTVLWQIEHNGSWNWEIGDTFATNHYLKISGPSEQENGWWKNLEPNETFVSVKTAVAIAENGFENALWDMTQYRRKYTYRSEKDARCPVIFNDFNCCLRSDPTSEKEIPVIDAAKEAGAEIFCMDAGWYADGTWWNTVGEWKVFEPRFPGGLKKVFDYIHKKGMDAGIWIEPEVMGINCPILDQFDDSCFFMRHGKRVIDHGRYQLDFRSPKVRIFLDKIIDGLIHDYHLEYLKFDYNIDAGVGTELDADSFGDGLYQNNEAFLQWVDNLTARHPGIIIENCSSGGMRMDNKTLQHFSLQSLTDAEKFEVIGSIAAMSSTAVLPEQAAVWCIPKKEDEEGEIVCNMVNTMFRRVHLSGETAELNTKQMELVKEGIAFYKETRRLIPQMRPTLPLGIVQFEDDIKCCGYEIGNTEYICITNIGDEEQKLRISTKAKKAKIVYPNAYMGTKIQLQEDHLMVEIDKRTGAVIQIEK